ncbi:MAG: hypothetical protein NG747_10420 [Candidatus Brocadia sp.]|nr:hypothetical protein [Candidatus Brocadia sp.]
MRQKARILGITLALIGASIALEAILVSAYPQTVDVKKGTDAINKFLECINTKIEEKKNAGGINISDTVACLPGSCTVTATMSEDSAQEACFSGGPEKCQLPRVIVKCPGSSESPQMEFSYLLCGTGSVQAGNEIGSNRVEVGAVVGETGSGTVMVMADIPVPPGGTATISDVISVGTNGMSSRGTKRCNDCHGDAGIAAGTGTPQLSERIEVFGTMGAPTTARNPSLIIFTDDSIVAKTVETTCTRRDLKTTKEFSDICDCIDMLKGTEYQVKDAEGKVKGTVTAEQSTVMAMLCRELEKYQHHTPLSLPPTCTPTPTPSPTPTPTPTPTPKPTGTPTVVTLAYFTAEAGDNGVVTLSWETVAEVDNAGFNLYRAKHKNGAYTRINDALIPAQGDAVSGASYSYVDAPGKGAFYYKLEDVDYYGVSTMHGPEKVRVRSDDATTKKLKKQKRK